MPKYICMACQSKVTGGRDVSISTNPVQEQQITDRPRACTLVQYFPALKLHHTIVMAQASRRDVRFSADRIRQGGNALVETLQKCSEGDVELDANRYAA